MQGFSDARNQVIQNTYFPTLVYADKSQKKIAACFLLVLNKSCTQPVHYSSQI